MSKKLYQDAEWLREKYWGEELTLVEMGELASCSDGTIGNWLVKYNIPRRSPTEAAQANYPHGAQTYHCKEWLQLKHWEEELTISKMAELGGCSTGRICHWMHKHDVPLRRHADRLYKNADWLEGQYWDNELTMAQIGKLAGCTEGIIRYWMRKHNISTRRTTEILCWDKEWLRKQYWDKKLSARQIGKLANCSNTTVLRWLTKHDISIRSPDRPLCLDEAWLRQKYWDKELSLEQIGRLVNCGSSTIRRWMGEYGIPRRTREEWWATRTGDALYRSKEWLHQKYWDEKLTLAQIGELAGCAAQVVRGWMIKYDVPIRTGKEAAGLSSSLGRHANSSEAIKAAWARGAFDGRDENGEGARKKSEAMKEKWAQGDYDSLSGAMKDRWERGDFGNFTEVMKTRWANGVYDNISEIAKADWAQGRRGNQAWRDQHSRAMKEAWARGAYDNRLPIQSPTNIEIETAEALDTLGIEHQAQYRPDGYSRIYDELVLPNVLIEVNGNYFHSEANFPGVNERDAEKRAWAEANGYYFVTVWEHEIKEQGALALIQERVLPLLMEMQ